MNDQPTQPPNSQPITALTIPVQHIESPEEVIGLQLSDADRKKLRKRRAAEAVAEARALNAVGAKVLRVKNRTYQKIGGQLEDLGVRKIANGRIAIAGQNADLIIARCDEIIQASVQSATPPDLDKIGMLMRIQLEANGQLISLSQEQIKASAAPIVSPPTANAVISLPPGTQALVHGGHPKPKPIEGDTGPA